VIVTSDTVLRPLPRALDHALRPAHRQVVDAFPDDTAPSYLLRDHDACADAARAFAHFRLELGAHLTLGDRLRKRQKVGSTDA
jgi:hypothetical protein